MRFISFFENIGEVKNGVVLNNNVFDIEEIHTGNILDLVIEGKVNDPNFHELIKKQVSNMKKSKYSFSQFEKAEKEETYGLLIPYHPPEVWACGVTYKKVMELHEEDVIEAKGFVGLYSYVYDSERPEIFFKGLAQHCIGTNEEFSIRCDSNETFIEAELAIIFDAKGEIVAFTAANDITAWDIEKECPLFLNQAKIFTGSCVLGPSIVPAAFIKNPLDLMVKCQVIRNGELIYDGSGSTSRMKRTLNEFKHYLLRNNTITDGTILCTGTAVGIPNNMYMKHGDLAIIKVEKIGTIKNYGKKLTLNH
jgi:2-dehydro-3-deoxy-D-arabinonate dehydratase